MVLSTNLLRDHPANLWALKNSWATELAASKMIYGEIKMQWLAVSAVSVLQPILPINWDAKIHCSLTRFSLNSYACWKLTSS